MKEHIQYDFLFDNHFNELKEIEMMNQRIATVTQMDPFVGKYYSIEHVRRQVLLQRDEEYKEMDKQIKKEIEAGLVIDPINVTELDMLDRQNAAFAPEIDAQSAEDEHQRELEAEKAKPKLPQAKSSNNTK